MPATKEDGSTFAIPGSAGIELRACAIQCEETVVLGERYHRAPWVSKHQHPAMLRHYRYFIRRNPSFTAKVEPERRGKTIPILQPLFDSLALSDQYFRRPVINLAPPRAVSDKVRAFIQHSLILCQCRPTHAAGTPVLLIASSRLSNPLLNKGPTAFVNDSRPPLPFMR